MTDHRRSPSRSIARHLRSLAPHAVLTLGAFTLLAAGCNTILDNRPAELDPAAGAKSDPSTEKFYQEDEEEAACAEGSRLCSESCVSNNDPNFGCGDPKCEPCNSTHASVACGTGGCEITACDEDHGDCNGTALDGCEADFYSASTCGGCNSVCPQSNPLCAPFDGGFRCSKDCPANAPLQCGTECVAPLTNARHCGGCGAACPDVAHAKVTCEAGACKVTCETGYHACDGTCVSDTDPASCGPACTPCSAPPNASATCSSNACGFQCAAGFADCNKNAADGCEVTLATDLLNCGACGVACPDVAHASVACEAGSCKVTCEAGYHSCGGTCAIDTDPAACGPACTPCPTPPNASPTCASNACGFQCEAGFSDCNKVPDDGCEVTLATDPLNCGACGNSCNGGACVGGVCQPVVLQCADGLADCNKVPDDGCEVTLATDPLNCGACGNACNGGACAGGVCQPVAPQCADGLADCNKVPDDGCEVTLAADPLNCGACGNSCNGGACVGGVCQPVEQAP